MVVELINDLVDDRVLLVNLIGSRFWREWESKKFFNYIKPLGKKYNNVDYDYFAVTGVKSVEYVVPCLDAEGRVSLNCTRESYELKVGENEFKVSSFRNLVYQVLKSNVNYVYYLTSERVFVDERFRGFVDEFIKFIPEVVDYSDVLKSLYGVSVGSFKSSEGQTNNRKDVSRFINSLRYSIITIYLYHHPEDFEKYLFAYNVRKDFDDIFGEVISIVRPRFYSDVIHYLADLKHDIFSRRIGSSGRRGNIVEFLDFVREVQLFVDKL